jgi:PAS domain S-box-containing protein
MDASTQRGQVLDLAGVLAREGNADEVLAAALPLLLDISGAAAVLVFSRSAAGLQLTTRAGLELSVEAAQDGWLDRAPETPHLSDAAVPASWETQGIARVASHVLSGKSELLTFAWTRSVDEPAELALAVSALDARLARARTEESLADLASRVDSAQQLAEMGDYDWHIPSDTNTWSDQLFRIYGYEPGSFHPSYEKFLSLIHPEDRDRISALHQNAYATGEPYQMIERIVRPDGEVRYLSSNGEVIFEENTPVRMRGTCVDITERVLGDRERERIAARFQGLVDSAPDAILVLGEDLRVMEANQRAHELLGGEPRGHRIHEILPGWPDNGASAVRASGLRGNDLELDVTTVVVKPTNDAGPASRSTGSSDSNTVVALFLRDARARLEREAMAARLAEAQLRRRQALEINDSVVQGLVAALYSLDQGSTSGSAAYLEHTLASARAMMDDLLVPLDGHGLRPGDLVRTAPVAIGEKPGVASPRGETLEERAHRVLVVDDAEDIRMLLRLRVEARNGLTVVGEAADGVAAVELASELQPDLVLLDLAMPRMDGLEALPLIRAAVPDVRVVVLSGFNQGSLANKALEAGADHYVVKGGSMRELLDLAESLLAPAS